MNKKDKKAFFRILKELGIYTEWVKYRKKHMEIQCSNDILPKTANGNFGHDVSSSFLFVNTNNEKMWYAIASPTYNIPYSDILNNESLIREIKERINVFTNGE